MIKVYRVFGAWYEGEWTVGTYFDQTRAIQAAEMLDWFAQILEFAHTSGNPDDRLYLEERIKAHILLMDPGMVESCGLHYGVETVEVPL